MFFLPSSVNLNFIKVNGIANNSNISTGSNVMMNRNASLHKNEGFGEQNADGVEVHIPISYVDDGDLIDSVAVKKTI